MYTRLHEKITLNNNENPKISKKKKQRCYMWIKATKEENNKTRAKSVSPVKPQLHTSCFISHATNLASAVAHGGLSASYLMSKTIHCN